MDIVFAKTRYVYDSYTDFWKLVELSGFETCYTDEVDVRRHKVYITTPYNGEWKPHIHNQVERPRNAYLIHWCLERPSGAGGMGNYAIANRAHMYDRQFDETWVSDRRMSQEAMLRFVILGSDYGLGEPSTPEYRRYDFVHMSYITDRRARIYNYFHRDYIGPNCWPWEENPSRDEVMRQSKFALNIHQDQYPYQEPLRFALFAAYGLPILTEEIYDAHPWNEDMCVFNPYDGIAGRLRQMLGNDYTRWYDLGMNARDVMCDQLQFRKTVIQAVSESIGGFQ